MTVRAYELETNNSAAVTVDTAQTVVSSLFVEVLLRLSRWTYAGLKSSMQAASRRGGSAFPSSRYLSAGRGHWTMDRRLPSVSPPRDLHESHITVMRQIIGDSHKSAYLYLSFLETLSGAEE